MQLTLVILLVISLLTQGCASNHAINSLAGAMTCDSKCDNGVCLDLISQQTLNNEEVSSLLTILNKHENSTVPFATRSIKSVIDRDVYLLSGHTPDYYGVELIVSREITGWNVIKTIERVF